MARDELSVLVVERRVLIAGNMKTSLTRKKGDGSGIVSVKTRELTRSSSTVLVLVLTSEETRVSRTHYDL